MIGLEPVETGFLGSPRLKLDVLGNKSYSERDYKRNLSGFPFIADMSESQAMSDQE